MELTPYGFCLGLGAAGLGAMAVSGHWHRGDPTVARGIDHQLGAPGPTSSLAHHGDPSHALLGAVIPAGGPKLWSWLSPRSLFGLLVGAGAGGSAVATLGREPWPLVAAVACGLAFELLVLAPLQRWLLGFGSRPARTLETALFDHAIAASRFDARGHGIVSLELDGHVVHVLGVLRAEEGMHAAEIRPGDPMLVEAVDPELNRCTVSRR